MLLARLNNQPIPYRLISSSAVCPVAAGKR